LNRLNEINERLAGETVAPVAQAVASQEGQRQSATTEEASVSPAKAEESIQVEADKIAEAVEEKVEEEVNAPCGRTS
jgi:hypothetical protein